MCARSRPPSRVAGAVCRPRFPHHPACGLGSVTVSAMAGLTVSHGERTLLSMEYRDRIIVDPKVRFGKPTVRGTRITVGDVLSYLASGMTEDEILADFPQLSREDLRACLAFAAERERRLASVPGS